ncbi:MarR family winged helix-turn-helix transcriptional regulator [Eggerthella guodeyinii]|uniref:MarR family transcriptional regulator n=1 Tax=Eggerthella guodeyinii TaxID=2690837 RepID=A0A6N7RLN3_9ACTN|nr:MarR family transcriptional regulator [Eggerthella guodeyinii]MRX81831.1 MarR family transcriptional regulator [Eggerthella guodeyinii]
MINQHNSLIGFLVYDAQRAIAKSLETALKPYDITPGQWNLINQLDSAGELSQKQLAERTRKEQATITRYLDTLERKGLVVRNQHKSDRRAHAISVTDKAHELVMAVQPITVDAADRLIEGIDQADLDTFVAVLAKLKENADNFTEDN